MLECLSRKLDSSPSGIRITSFTRVGKNNADIYSVDEMILFLLCTLVSLLSPPPIGHGQPTKRPRHPESQQWRWTHHGSEGRDLRAGQLLAGHSSARVAAAAVSAV